MIIKSFYTPSSFSPICAGLHAPPRHPACHVAAPLDVISLFQVVFCSTRLPLKPRVWTLAPIGKIVFPSTPSRPMAPFHAITRTHTHQPAHSHGRPCTQNNSCGTGKLAAGRK
ncbi:unnamed protein product [Protopolystoma xenopodis]|uniref:Uncharacterized protein n=1 Tax=Protopolystoma xenopodis TaxID=117903 RepID=A0A3S5CKR7_9PLAT|nr:unnamed protein product [Protopolystoma xenopodis]